MTSQIVLIVEDEDYVFDGMQLYCKEKHPDWHIENFPVEGNFAEAKDVIAQAKECNANVVVLDMQFGEEDWAGLELIQPLHKDNPSRPIIICTVHNPESEKAQEALNRGALDYVRKEGKLLEEQGGIPAFIPELMMRIERIIKEDG